MFSQTRSIWNVPLVSSRLSAGEERSPLSIEPPVEGAPEAGPGRAAGDSRRTVTVALRDLRWPPSSEEPGARLRRGPASWAPPTPSESPPVS